MALAKLFWGQSGCFHVTSSFKALNSFVIINVQLQHLKESVALRLKFGYWRQMGEMLKIIRGRLVG